MKTAKKRKTAPSRPPAPDGYAEAEAWRLHRTHDLWVEIREGYGTSNRMVADCLRPADAEHIVNMHNTLLEAIKSWRKAEKRHAAIVLGEIGGMKEEAKEAADRALHKVRIESVKAGCG